MSQSSTTGRASEPTPAQLKELFSQIEAGRVTKERLQDFLRGQTPAFPSYAVTVDYGQTVEQLVRNGRYDGAHVSITSSHFPLTKRGKEDVEVAVEPIDRVMSTEAVFRMIDQLGLRRPNVKEGLSLGAQYPDLQLEGPIVILCEPWRNPYGDLGVPCLSRNGSNRYLFLNWFGGDWHPYWRFAAVRK